MARILAALSGGVDSAVAALLLKEQGHDVCGAYIRTWMNEEMPLADCPAQRDIEDARAVAAHLGIPFGIVNLVNEYRERVVRYLVDGYRRGLTPNPDMMCNREMKFGMFRDHALGEGFDAVATGHYVRRETRPDGGFRLLEGSDPEKDQSYFLALLANDQIRDARFPLGNYRKAEVREIARARGLPNAAKKDSQGICFLGDMNINRFLEHYIEDRPGPIVDTAGTTIGEHRGLHRYTMGQRRGIGIPSNTDNEYYVVCGFDMERNTLIVGFDRPETPGLHTSRVEVDDLSFIGAPVTATRQLLARPRYRDPPQPVTYRPHDAHTATVEFASPQRALAPGQILALYDGAELLGGGFYR